MVRTAATPTIAVHIGRQGRLYHALVTTAPADLDAPSTMTLFASTLSEVAGLAAEPDTLRSNQDEAARLVLVDATELTWQKARYRSGHHLVAATDPILVGLSTLQHWLWQRLRSPLVPNSGA